MILLKEVLDYLDQYLSPEKFQDYAPNGLQVEGKKEIQKIVTGVSACQALFDEAIRQNADAILVHHGFFWKDEDPRVIRFKKNRLATLLKNDINLIGYHLPLDAHPACGNNALLAKLFEFQNAKPVEMSDGLGLVWRGELSPPMQEKDFCALLESKLQRKPLFIPCGDKPIKTLAWCSGGGRGYTNEVATLGVDAYLTGEISENIVHIARESNMHLIAAGHHATERCGIKILGEHLAEKFKLDHQFIDIDNPV